MRKKIDRRDGTLQNTKTSDIFSYRYCILKSYIENNNTIKESTSVDTHLSEDITNVQYFN